MKTANFTTKTHRHKAGRRQTVDGLQRPSALYSLLSIVCLFLTPTVLRAATHVTGTYSLGANPSVMATVNGTPEYGLVFVQRSKLVTYNGVQYGTKTSEGYLDANGALNDGAGNLWLDLIPSTTASPSDSYYVVTINIQGSVHSEIWVVPDVATVDATAVRQAQPPSAAHPSLFYQFVQQSGSDLPQRQKLNLTGSGVSCADDAAQLSTDCTITGGTGGGGSAPIASATTSGTVKTDSTVADPAVYLKTTADSLLAGKANLVHTHAESDVTNLVTDLAAKVPTSRTISTSAPLAGGGSLLSNLNLSIPAASGSQNGYLSTSDWSAFNSKESPLTFSPPLSRSVNTITCPTCEITGHKNAANGYAGLTASSKLNPAQGQEVWSVTDLTDYSATSGSGPTALKTTISSPSSGQCLTWSGSNWVNGSCSGGSSAHNLLSATHPDTVPASPVLGDILFANSTPAWTKLTGNTSSTREFLSQTGTGSASAAPAWAQIDAADVSGLAASATTDTTNASNISNGTLPAGRLPAPSATTLGGVESKDCAGTGHVLSINTDGTVTCSADSGGGMTNPMTTPGDMIYEDNTPAAARLAGNTTTTRKFLRQTGTGSASAAPAWDTLQAADIPDISATYQAVSEKNAASGYAGLDSSSKLAASQLPNPSASTLGGVESHSAVSNEFLTQIGTDGSVSGAQPDFSSLSGTATNAQLPSAIDFTSKTSTAPVKADTAANAPSSCTANKELYIETDATAGQQLFICNSTGDGWNLVGDGGGAGGGITSLNGLTASTQTFATGTSGTDFDISSSSSTHTFNIPDASNSARGLVTTGAQTFGGVKNFQTNVTINASVPAAHTGSGFEGLWIGDQGALFPGSGGTPATYANTILANNMCRGSSAWTLCDASRPAWNFQLGTGTSTDRFYIERSPSGSWAPVAVFSITNTGTWRMGSDNTQDIGETSNYRPKTIYAGTSVIAPTINATTGFQVGGSALNFSNLAGTVGDAQIAAGAVDGGAGGEIADGTVDSNDLATANKTLSKDFVIPSPTTSNSNQVQIYWPAAVTIQRIACSTDTGTVGINFDERAESTPNTAGTNTLSSALSCTTTTGTTTSFSDSTIAADVPYNLQITATSGTPGVVRIHVKAQVN